MAASVGAVGCDYVKGAGAATLRERVLDWFVPGVAGRSALLLGANDGDCSFRAIKFGTLAAVQGWYASLEAVQGTIVTITDDWGHAWANYLVKEVSVVGRSPATGASDPTVAARGEVVVRGVLVQ